MGMDDNFTRISLSTAELEENEGDIMFDKVCMLVFCSLCEASLVRYVYGQLLNIYIQCQCICSFVCFLTSNC